MTSPATPPPLPPKTPFNKPAFWSGFAASAASCLFPLVLDWRQKRLGWVDHDIDNAVLGLFIFDAVVLPVVAVIFAANLPTRHFGRGMLLGFGLAVLSFLGYGLLEHFVLLKYL